MGLLLDDASFYMTSSLTRDLSEASRPSRLRRTVVSLFTQSTSLSQSAPWSSASSSCIVTGHICFYFFDLQNMEVLDLVHLLRPGYRLLT
jgi:hypothetical protein